MYFLGSALIMRSKGLHINPFPPITNLVSALPQGYIANNFWIDCFGNTWPVIKSKRRLKFKYPLHAALRKHIFHRDNYQCKHCGITADDIPEGWDGTTTLFSQSPLINGFKTVLVVDHILTLLAGGLNVPENLQTLCETCNRKKIKIDLQNISAYRGLK